MCWELGLGNDWPLCGEPGLGNDWPMCVDMGMTVSCVVTGEWLTCVGSWDWGMTDPCVWTWEWLPHVWWQGNDWHVWGAGTREWLTYVWGTRTREWLTHVCGHGNDCLMCGDRGMTDPSMETRNNSLIWGQENDWHMWGARTGDVGSWDWRMTNPCLWTRNDCLMCGDRGMTDTCLGSLDREMTDFCVETCEHRHR
jgi:hypothetical protein